MRSFALAGYSIRFESRTTSDLHNPHLIPLDNGKRMDAYNIIVDSLNELLTKKFSVKDREIKCYYSVDQLDSDEERRIIYGYVKKGDYGYKSEIKNTESDKIVYDRSKSDTDLLPYFFYIDFEKNRPSAILVIERIGNIGIKREISEIITTAIGKKTNNVRLSTHPYIPEKYADRILKNGAIISVKLIKRRPPRDHSEKLTEDIIDPYTEVRLRAGKNSPFSVNKLWNFRDKKEDKILEHLGLQKFDYDEVKVEVSTNGKRRTFKLGEHLETINHFDISDSVLIDEENGLPELSSLLQLTEEYIIDIKTSIRNTL